MSHRVPGSREAGPVPGVVRCAGVRRGPAGVGELGHDL